MPVSAHDVARELRERLRDPGVLKVHKLLYYCQGWHMAWTGGPMFEEPIEAWANGPVVADFWHDEDKDRGSPSPITLDSAHLATIDYVVSRYGHLTGKQLIALTHSETPWRAVSESDDPWTMRNPVIAHDALRAWFSEDEEYLAHRAAVRKLRERRDVYGFEGPAMPDDLRQATLQMLGDGGFQLATG